MLRTKHSLLSIEQRAPLERIGQTRKMDTDVRLDPRSAAAGQASLLAWHGLVDESAETDLAPSAYRGCELRSAAIPAPSCTADVPR
jgi:hypothetical protein